MVALSRLVVCWRSTVSTYNLLCLLTVIFCTKELSSLRIIIFTSQSRIFLWFAIDQKNYHLHNDRVANKWRNNVPPVFTLNFLPHKPTDPASSNIYRPTINSTGPNLKTTLMTINSNHQNSKDDDVHVTKYYVDMSIMH